MDVPGGERSCGVRFADDLDAVEDRRLAAKVLETNGAKA